MPRLARSQFNSTPATKCNKTPPEQPALPETCATHARAPMQPHDNVVYAPQVNADCRGSESASGRGCSAIRKEPRLPEDAGIHQHALTRRASRVIMHTGTRSVRERKRERERYPLITSIHGCGRNPPPIPASPAAGMVEFAMPKMLRAHALCLRMCVRARVRVRVGWVTFSFPNQECKSSDERSGCFKMEMGVRSIRSFVRPFSSFVHR